MEQRLKRLKNDQQKNTLGSNQDLGVLSSGQKISGKAEGKAELAVLDKARAADAGGDAELGGAASTKQMAGVELPQRDLGIVISSIEDESRRKLTIPSENEPQLKFAPRKGAGQQLKTPHTSL